MIDNRGLDEQIFSNSAHPISLIEDLLDRLSNECFFYRLPYNLKLGYHPTTITDKEKEEMTAFVVPWTSTNGKLLV